MKLLTKLTRVLSVSLSPICAGMPKNSATLAISRSPVYKLEICDKVEGFSGPGPRQYRSMCYEQYAREKKDIAVCERLKDVDPPDEILYVSCIESVQRWRGSYTLEDCLKIKDSEGMFFIDCVGGLAKQNKDTSLCTSFFSNRKEVDIWGDTPLSRCERQAESKQ